MTGVSLRKERTRPSAFQGLVDETPLKGGNSLIDKRSYVRVGSNNILDVVPGIIHFGGFQINKPQRQIVRIRNAAGFSTRVHVLPPNTPFFQMGWRKHRGLIAPGMCEEVEIEFHPKEWRYYYDCIRVHSEGENLLVPIHGYPTMNESRFPSQVDFGLCRVGEPTEKIIEMKCKVPIDFEFEIRIVKGCSSFTIAPLQGIVPADGVAFIALTFCPNDFTTQEMVIEVHTSEINSEPKICSITGSGFPGKHLDEQFPEICTASEKNTSERVGETMKKLKMHIKKKKESPDKHLEPKTPETGAERPVVMENMNTHAGIAKILNQEEGKLEIADIKGAIETRKGEIAEKNRELDAVLLRGKSEKIDPLDDPNLPISIKEAIFRRQLEDVRKHKKRIEMTSCVSLGSKIMSDEEIQQAFAAKQEVLDSQNISERMQASKRFQAERVASGAIRSVNPEAPENVLVQTCSQTFDFNKGSDWAKRTTAFHRFRCAARTVLIQARAQKRVLKINALLGQLDFDKEKIAEEVENPKVTVASSSSGNRFDLSEVVSKSSIRTWPFAKYDETEFFDCGKVEPGHYKDYDELRQHELKVPLKYKHLGYEEEKFPDFDYCMALLEDQPLMTGAEEEALDAVECGVVSVDSMLQEMPEALNKFPYDTYKIGSRYSDEKVFKAPPPSWGYDPKYPIKPQKYDFINTSKTEDRALNSVRAMERDPKLSDTWKPRFRIPKVTEDHYQPLMDGPDPDDDISTSMKVDPETIQKMKDAVDDLCKPGDESPEADKEFEMPRTKCIQELAKQKEASRKAAIDEYQDSVKKFNKKLNKPSMHAIK
ncbi:hypothetical protein BSKO_02076 [Bryopsis sp. KO-2023]|nr:hypothetical protein BSKO_02076 [Bryopsis sp. KO-2023]